MLSAHPPQVWIGFTALIVTLLIVDLGILNRRSHVLSLKESLRWSIGLVTLALLFCGFLWYSEGRNDALQFLTGYLIEFSLSIDNLFVFILVLQFFSVPAKLQPKVLKWGILGAMIMRGIMIALGTVLLARFHWIIYVFGGILIITGIRMFFADEADRIEPDKNPVVRLAKRLLPFTDSYHEDRFFTKLRTGWHATPLFLVLIAVEWSDLVFAIDSIPAIFSVTSDPFIVYSSNVFAILGLRAFFFLLAQMLDQFHYLKHGVALILVFVGVKMLIAVLGVHIPTTASLLVIVMLLAGAILASLRHAAAKERST